jgi:IS30 family transposase
VRTVKVVVVKFQIWSVFTNDLNRIDAQRRLSMTYDQRREMSQHEQLSERTGVKVYFADPRSP